MCTFAAKFITKVENNMGDFLNMDNILTEDEAVSLFTDTEDAEKQAPSQPEDKEKPADTEQDNEQDNNETTEVDSEELFGDEETDKPESVGGGKKNTSNQEDADSQEDDTSPDNNNFYSSIASALKGEGVLPDLDDSEIEAIKEPEDFRDLIQKQINAGVDEITKRVNQALSDGVPANTIKQYENTLGYLNSISEELLMAESDLGEDIRRKLIQQDLMNRGYSAERAVKLTEKFFASGDDIEEAKTALESNKEHFSNKYREILNNAKAETEKLKKAAKKQAEDLKKDILNSETVLGDIKLDKNTRQKVYDNISRPVWKDPETGEYYTAVQKYRKENENDYIKYMGLFFTLTNGFKDMDNIIKPQAKKEIKSKLRELEHTINGTARNNNGTLKYVGTGEERQQGSLFDRGFAIDIR